MKQPQAIFLLGPTASGKTALAMHLADLFPVEIISVDSALVYRDMNIGTAKPDGKVLQRYPHHLIDLIDPTQSYSAAQFCKDALLAMAQIYARGKIPLLTGGTMLYVKALLEGFSDLPEGDEGVRRVLVARAALIGWPAMHVELARVDPLTASRLKPTDAQRIQRALEVFELTGSKISALQTRSASQHRFPYSALKIGLIAGERAMLHERIASRFDAMLETGLVNEVVSLRERYSLKAELPSMRCVGYRQTWQYLEGEIDRDKLRETGVIATRQLAKRQLTWLRSMPDFLPVDCLRTDLQANVAAQVVQFFDEH